MMSDTMSINKIIKDWCEIGGFPCPTPEKTCSNCIVCIGMPCDGSEERVKNE